MDTRHLDLPCGLCEGRGRREVPGGRWRSAPLCPDCAGVGYLVASEDAERLLAFLRRHLVAAPSGDPAPVRRRIRPRRRRGRA